MKTKIDEYPQKQYLLSTIEKDLIKQLEKDKKIILGIEDNNDVHYLDYVNTYMHRFKHDPYKQAMVYANNYELWERRTNIKTDVSIKGIITSLIYKHLVNVADSWIKEQL